MTLFSPRAALLLISLISAQSAMAQTGLTASARAALSTAQQVAGPDTSAQANDGLTGVDHYPGTAPVPQPKPRAH
jgi:hypothetical protein